MKIKIIFFQDYANQLGKVKNLQARKVSYFKMSYLVSKEIQDKLSSLSPQIINLNIRKIILFKIFYLLYDIKCIKPAQLS